MKVKMKQYSLLMKLAEFFTISVKGSLLHPSYTFKNVKLLSDLAFPPLCVHCQGPTAKAGHLFCKGCTGFFELIDPQSRCPYCFAENDGRRPCPECVQKKRWQLKMASALDYLGAVSSLVKQLKYGRMPYLAQTGGQFLVAQFFRLKWPLPDMIVPVPRRHWFQGVNHALLLSQCLARSLGIPCRPLVKRKSGRSFASSPLKGAKRKAFLLKFLFKEK